MSACSTGRRLRTLATRLAGSSRDPALSAEDLLQEARVSVWQRRVAIAGSVNPRASVYLVARQAMVNALRRSRRVAPEHAEVREPRAVGGEDAAEDLRPKEGDVDGQ